ncbi:MAG: FecR domain-containing protein [Kiritimatiellae bacterium]|nr:FecR domain-containing protein [Kiritimatiellia bacterium]
MDPESAHLIETYLDGSIDIDSVRRLADRVRTDEVFRTELAGALRMRGLLQAGLNPDAACERLCAVVQTAISAARDRPRKKFDSRVMARLAGRKPRRKRGGRGASLMPGPKHRAGRFEIAVPPASGFRGAGTLALAASLLLVLGGLFCLLKRPPSPAPAGPAQVAASLAVARITNAGPGVTIVRSATSIAAHGGMHLLNGDILCTPPGAEAAIVHGTASNVIRLGDDTYLRLAADGRENQLEVETGSVEAAIARQMPGRAYTFVSPHAVATVVGTRLRIEVRATATQVAVGEGAVRVSNRQTGEVVLLHAGQQATVAAQTQMTPATPSLPAVVGFTLIDADRDTPLTGFDPIADGATIRLAALPTRNLNIRANTRPVRVGSVRFVLNGMPTSRIENGTTAPIYSLAGDMHGDYHAWRPQPGPYTVTAIPYTGQEAGGEQGAALTLRFVVVAR